MYVIPQTQRYNRITKFPEPSQKGEGRKTWQDEYTVISWTTRCIFPQWLASGCTAYSALTTGCSRQFHVWQRIVWLGMPWTSVEPILMP